MASIHDLVTGDAQRGITAVLGPTNTGKTHLALERMLRHRTGMIGLPLRLLAREVYDKLVDRVGEGSVALITGEEKRVPPRARFYVCTVEAMPVDKHVHFLAVDEIQLAAHRTRGHVFTDRLLNARGAVETLFLGAGTARGVVQSLVPTAEIEGQPRLSRLSHTGHARLKRLPARSAVVAFSAARVYELAERLRRQHGGTAVVLGALSPRTRNAQVALYQSGEVPILVATDAIGMGLNMDVDHVAFADTRKFDGRTRRGLHDDELAQIAGRAGRFLRDGSFGTTDQAEPFDDETVDAIENHRFAPLRRLWWRNPELDFGSVGHLLDSLEKPPPSRILKRMPDAWDHLALQALSRDAEVTARARGEPALRLLWEVAGIPDYRKRLTEAHAELLAEIYVQLLDRGELPPGWIEERLRRLDRTEGDIGTLMTRIAHVRTWTFVSHKEAWLASPGALQARTRALEDRLSDALHQQLTARFVDHRVNIVVHTGPVEIDPQGVVRMGERSLARIEGLEVQPGLPPGRLGELARAVVVPALRDRALELVADADAAFEVDPEGRISWRGDPVARWVKGAELRAPAVRVRGLPLLGEAHRAALRLRIAGWTRDHVQATTSMLRHPDRRRLGRRAERLVQALELGMGMAPPVDPRELDDLDRRTLARMGIRLGRLHAYVPDLLGTSLLPLRSALWTAWSGRAPSLPAGGAVSMKIGRDAPFWAASGWPVAGPLAVRADVLEKLAAAARRAGRRGPFGLPREAPSWLGASPADTAAVLDALGYRKVEVGGEWRFVPPARSSA